MKERALRLNMEIKIDNSKMQLKYVHSDKYRIIIVLRNFGVPTFYTFVIILT